MIIGPKRPKINGKGVYHPLFGYYAMMCERCKHKDATVHLTEIIKGVRSEVHLCEHCAREIGLNSKLNGSSLSVPDMLSYLDEGRTEEYPGKVCPFCGISTADIEASGKVGCMRCYETFSGEIESLYPGLRSPYAGKHPAGKGGSREPNESQRENGTALLRRELEEAVREERYEDAARLRDLIGGRA